MWAGDWGSFRVSSANGDSSSFPLFGLWLMKLRDLLLPINLINQGWTGLLFHHFSLRNRKQYRIFFFSNFLKFSSYSQEWIELGLENHHISWNHTQISYMGSSWYRESRNCWCWIYSPPNRRWSYLSFDHYRACKRLWFSSEVPLNVKSLYLNLQAYQTKQDIPNSDLFVMENKGLYKSQSSSSSVYMNLFKYQVTEIIPSAQFVFSLLKFLTFIGNVICGSQWELWCTVSNSSCFSDEQQGGLKAVSHWSRFWTSFQPTHYPTNDKKVMDHHQTVWSVNSSLSL